MINGIANNEKDARANADYFLSLSDKKLNLIMMYNATHNFSNDILEARMNQNEIATTPTSVLQRTVRSILQNDKRNLINLISFSQGAVSSYHCLNSLYSFEQDRIRSLAAGPARVIPPRLAAKSFNIASKRDPIPFTDFKHWDNLKYLERLEPHKDAKLFDHEFQSPTIRKKLKRLINELN